MLEIQKVIETIRLLTSKTVSRGCTEHEAMAASAKIGELLKVYNLSMDQVFLDNSKCTTVTINTGIFQRRPINRCLVALADFCDCKVWFSTTNDGIVYHFFGLQTDTEMAKYLYEMIDAAVETEIARFKASATYLYAQTHRKRLSSSFQHGMVGRIANRLANMTQERQKEESVACPVQQSTGTSLIVIKHNKVQSEFEKLSLGIRKAACSARATSHDAYRRGMIAGDHVNLNRPITGTIAGYLQ